MPKLQNMELTNELHQHNIEEVAYYLSRGFKKFQFVTSDEFALLFFPTATYKYEEKGVKHVYGTTGDDKRQCTGNAALLGDGTLLGGLIIVAGKTDRVLPQKAKADPSFKSWHFDRTSNHWCDMRSKKEFISFLWQNFVNLWAAKKGVSLEVAEREAECVFFMDCWAVNIRYSNPPPPISLCRYSNPAFPCAAQNCGSGWRRSTLGSISSLYPSDELVICSLTIKFSTTR